MQQEQEGLAPQKSLNDDDRQNLNQRLDSLQGMLDLFPDVSVVEPPQQDTLAKTEAWSRTATVAIFNIFNLLAQIPYRTRQMDKAVDQVKRAFHAVFELVFSTKRSPMADDFDRARSAVEHLLITCRRLV